MLLGKLNSYIYKNEIRTLTPHTEINSKWIQDLTVRRDIIKLLEENKGRILFDINHYNIFLDLPLKVMKINK